MFFFKAQVRTIVFIDGQNLYHLAKNAWGDKSIPHSPYKYPSYDVEKLANTLITGDSRRVLTQTRFYTGVPDKEGSPKQVLWHEFWNNKLRYLKSRGIYVYRGRVNPGGQEKGVDVSIAVDLVELTYDQNYDVAIIVSQDWDFGPAIRLAKRIAKKQKRHLIFESAFPYQAGKVARRGIPGTKWIHIDKTTYDSCFDPTDYRSKL